MLRTFWLKPLAFTALAVGWFAAANAESFPGSRLLGTGGVTQLEGSAGGGLTPWALIAGLGSENEVGASSFCTRVRPQDFMLTSCGAAIGVINRVELSYARQQFDLGTTVPGKNIKLDIVGAKVRVLGDAVFSADAWRPQVAVGMQYKYNRDYDLVPTLLGAKDDAGIDIYLAATKVWLDGPFSRTLLANATLRATKANQLGILGFGGDSNDGYSLMPEFSTAVFVTDNLLVGAEYRFKPDNLSVFEEDDFVDAFLAYIPHKSVALVAAYAELGTIADKKRQHGYYASIQVAF